MCRISNTSENNSIQFAKELKQLAVAYGVYEEELQGSQVMLLAPERHILNFYLFRQSWLCLSRERGCIAINVMSFVCYFVTRLLLDVTRVLLAIISRSVFHWNYRLTIHCAKTQQEPAESVRYFKTWQSRREHWSFEPDNSELKTLFGLR